MNKAKAQVQQLKSELQSLKDTIKQQETEKRRLNELLDLKDSMLNSNALTMEHT